MFHIKKGSDNTPLPLGYRISTNPIFLSLLGVLLIIATSTYLVSSYSANQKLKLDKITKVLEQVSNYEAAVEDITKEIKVIKISGQEGVLSVPTSDDFKKKYDQSEKLKADILNSLDENRFLLGEEIYNPIKNYINGTYDYYLNIRSGKASDEMKEKRTQEMNKVYQLPKRI